jgi:hypothetical protein
MEESLQVLGEAAGWSDEALFKSLKSMRSNATPRLPVPLEVKRALAAINHLDMELYEHALHLFLQRSRQAAVQRARDAG